jgi:hypothetical protein
MCGANLVISEKELVRILGEYVDRQGLFSSKKDNEEFIKKFKHAKKRLPTLDDLWVSALDLAKLDKMSNKKEEKKTEDKKKDDTKKDEKKELDIDGQIEKLKAKKLLEKQQKETSKKSEQEAAIKPIAGIGHKDDKKGTKSDTFFDEEESEASAPISSKVSASSAAAKSDNLADMLKSTRDSKTASPQVKSAPSSLFSDVSSETTSSGDNKTDERQKRLLELKKKREALSVSEAEIPPMKPAEIMKGPEVKASSISIEKPVVKELSSAPPMAPKNAPGPAVIIKEPSAPSAQPKSGDVVICPVCGFRNPTYSKFCLEDGTPLG